MAGEFTVKNNSTLLQVADRVVVGTNVVLGPNCEEVRIGYGCFLGRDIYIDVPHFTIGDYTTVHHGCVIHGLKTSIGHNCWIGHYSVIDSLGGDTRIGNNTGVGAQSQLWSHIKAGDTMNGCRFNSAGRLHLDDDTWLVGHCIVGPIHAKRRSMLMAGSVMMKDMEENTIYAGTPAVEMTAKLGRQFEEVSLDERTARFHALRATYCRDHALDERQFPDVGEFSDDPEVTEFHIDTRSYRPVRTAAEFHFIKWMLYDKAKWLPVRASSQ